MSTAVDKNNRPRIIDNPHLTMFGDPNKSNKKKPKLSWGIRNGYPRITVFTNEANVSNPTDGIISAPLDQQTMGILINHLEKIAKQDKAEIIKTACLTSEYVNGTPSGQKILLSDVYIGKDEDGMVWVSLINENKPRIKFYFKLSEWHFINVNKEPITEQQASCLVAASYANLLREAYGAVIGSYFLTDNPGVYAAPQNVQDKKTDNKETNSESKDIDWDDVNF